LKSVVSWDITLCSVVETQRRFGGNLCSRPRMPDRWLEVSFTFVALLFLFCVCSVFVSLMWTWPNSWCSPG